MINPLFALLAVLGIALPPLLPSRDARMERRSYWVGAIVATVATFFALYPPDWRGGLVLAVVVAAILTVRAYLNTPYLVLRGRTLTFSTRNPDAKQSSDESALNSYGRITTAPKTWWLLLAIVIACVAAVAVCLLNREGSAYAVGASLAVGLVFVALGYQDGTGRFPVARRQIVQFTLVGFASVGVFVALYYLAYRLGRLSQRRPDPSHIITP
ncbi:hypothetical protein [Mycolicibacterium cosmeticum]|uniref:hypothetical protein n=1 Tax=Mycolicibacterium cosmeticum TaxID=258533 RepID=UPI0004631F75